MAEPEFDARAEMGEPAARGRYSVAMLMADAERAFPAAFPDRADMILGALEHLVSKRQSDKRTRGELRAAMRREGSPEPDFAFDVIYLCKHVSVLIDRKSWASVACRECGRCWPTPYDILERNKKEPSR